MMLAVRRDILLPYLAMAPLPLAFERTLEGALYADRRMERPVLDIGCGEGLFAKVVFDGRVDTGIDPDDRELRRAAALGAYDELIRCSGDSIPKPDATYRTIISNSVLEHIPDLDPVLREARRLLAPGGRFHLTVPTDRFERYTVLNCALEGIRLRAAAAAFRQRFNRFWKHYHCYPPAQWEERVRRAGFRVVETRLYDALGVCLLNDFLAPFSVTGFVVKKLTNRWTLFPGLRRALLYPVFRAARRLERGGLDERGGLVFITAEKDGPT